MAAYPGHVIYLNALKGDNAETKKENLQTVRSYAPDLEMIDFPPTAVITNCSWIRNSPGNTPRC